ncbi:MAG: serine hydrolase domain-containing protein, partial [bacterium]
MKDRKLSNQLAEYAANNEPGVQYVVVDKTSTIFSHSVGLLDIDKNIALNAGNTMAAFSMTKTLTAIAILQLVERNKIKLSDRVSEFVENPYNTNITIRHLLNHTSGIPNPIPLQWVHLAQNHVEFDEQAAFEEVLDKYPDLDSKPGEKYKYSNIGYWMLGGIIEKVTGKRYTEYVKQNIFQSLNLNSNEIGFQTHNE